MKPTIGNIVDTGKPLAIDIDRLLLTRMLLQADSGGGKTVALKRILEQTHGHVQQIIITLGLATYPASRRARAADLLFIE